MGASHYLTRHEDGQRAFTRLLNYWLRASDLTQRQFCCICHWAAGDSAWISSGPLSRLMNGEVQKISPGRLDLFATTNSSIWLFKEKGPTLAIQSVGNFSNWGVEWQWLEKAIWLPHPKEDNRPLGLGDLSEVVCGKLDLPYIASESTVGTSSSVDLRGPISQLLNQLVLDLGLSPKKGLETMVKSFPGLDSYSQVGSCRVFLSKMLVGSGCSSTSVEREIPRLAAMVGRLRGDQRFGEKELRSELESMLYS